MVGQRMAACVCVLLVSGGILPADERGGAAKVRPKLTVSRDTTRVTEPLAADGWPDYIGALNEQLSRGVTPENNSVVLLYRALGPAPGDEPVPDRFFELLGMPRPADDGRYFTGFESYLANAPGIDPADPEYTRVLDHLAAATSRPWTAEQYPHVAAWLQANAEPLKTIAESVRRPGYFSPLVPNPESPGLIGVSLPGVQKYRSVARALTARAMLRAARGETRAAWQDLLTVHRLGRLAGRGATMIEGIVGITIDGTAVTADLALVKQAQPDARTIRGWLADLEHLPALPRMVDKIDLGERYTYLDSVLLVARGDADAMELVDADSFAGKLLARMTVNAIDWDVVLRMGNESYDRLVAALRKPDRQERSIAAGAALDEIEALIREARDAAALQKLAADAKNPREAVSQVVARGMLALLMPAISHTVLAEDRAEQRLRNLRVALALAAHHHDHGHYPDRLDALSPRYLPELPQDVFTGEALVYRTAGKGYLLYSVGANGVDDDGRDDPTDPWEGDIAIRGD